MLNATEQHCPCRPPQPHGAAVPSPAPVLVAGAGTPPPPRAAHHLRMNPSVQCQALVLSSSARAVAEQMASSACAPVGQLKVCAKCVQTCTSSLLSPGFLVPQRSFSQIPIPQPASPAQWRARAAQPCSGDRSETWPPYISSNRQTAPRQAAGSEGAAGGEDCVEGSWLTWQRWSRAS